MSVVVEAQVGPRILADGSENAIRASKSGDIVTSDAHGKYMEAVYRGNCFFACAQTAITFSATITTTTAIGFILSNPPGSAKLLVPLQLELVNTGTIVGTAAVVVMPYSATAVTHSTALTVRNAYIGGPTGVGLADSGATLPIAPVVAKPLYSVLSTNTAVFAPGQIYDLGGSLILPQGTALAVLSTAAITAIVGCLWEEIPV